MTHRQVLSNGLEYDFAPDDSPVATHHSWAIASAQLFDDISEEPIRAALQIRVDMPGVFVKKGAQGAFCLVARPGLRFPQATSPRPKVLVHVTADGYLPLAIAFTIPFDARTVAAPALAAGSTVVTMNSVADLEPGQMVIVGSRQREEFSRILTLGPGANQITLSEPLRFAHPIGETAIPATKQTNALFLRRQPISLRGRVVRLGTGAAPPVPVQTSIRIADYWRTQKDVRTRSFIGSVPVGPMTVPGPTPRVFVLALGEGMASPRAPASRAAEVVLAPVSGDEKQLVRDAAPEQAAIRISDRRNLAPGDLLRVDASDAETSEIRGISTVVGAGGIDDPSTATLDLPLLHAHAPGARIDHVLRPSGPLPLVLSDGAEVGDRSVFLDTLPTLPRSAVRVVSAGIADEFHDCARYETTSDAQGYFRLPAIHRVAQVRLDVLDGATPVSFFVDPDYADREQWVDLRLK